MKPRSLFLNLSRGIAVDTAALRQHIESGHIAGAAVDVFPIEPKRQGDPFESDLRGLTNVILTPHVGGSTEEAQQDIGRFVASKLRAYAAFGGTSLSVNLPEINAAGRRHEAPAGASCTRNAPGRPGARSTGCSATTASTSKRSRWPRRGEIGYVITDIAAEVGPRRARRARQPARDGAPSPAQLGRLTAPRIASTNIGTTKTAATPTWKIASARWSGNERIASGF